jgi:predicted Fe-Mo cluster-binding NifX family protein
METKIAAVTEDQRRISSHFGRAPFYRVYTIQDQQIIAEEERPKPYHGEQANHSSHDHGDMFAPIADCALLLAGGMGETAYQKARAAGLEVILTGGEIQAAIQAYLKGEAHSDPRRIHHH